MASPLPPPTVPSWDPEPASIFVPGCRGAEPFTSRTVARAMPPRPSVIALISDGPMVRLLYCFLL